MNRGWLVAAFAVLAGAAIVWSLRRSAAQVPSSVASQATPRAPDAPDESASRSETLPLPDREPLPATEAEQPSGEVEELEGKRSDVAKSTRRPRVWVTGTLHLPAAWRRKGIRLSFSSSEWSSSNLLGKRLPIDGAQVLLEDMEASGQEEYQWDAGDLLAGEYIVVVEPCQTRRRIRVDPGKTEEVRIDVPPPTDVVLRFFDSDSGRAMQPVFVDYSIEPHGNGEDRHRLEHALGFPLSTSIGPDEDGVYRFQAPAGHLTVHAEGERRFADREFDLHPGQNDLRFECERAR